MLVFSGSFWPIDPSLQDCFGILPGEQVNEEQNSCILAKAEALEHVGVMALMDISLHSKIESFLIHLKFSPSLTNCSYNILCMCLLQISISFFYGIIWRFALEAVAQSSKLGLSVLV